MTLTYILCNVVIESVDYKAKSMSSLSQDLQCKTLMLYIPVFSSGNERNGQELVILFFSEKKL